MQISPGSSGGKIGAGTLSLGRAEGSLSPILESSSEIGTGLAVSSSILSSHSCQMLGRNAEPAATNKEETVRKSTLKEISTYTDR